MEEWAVYLGRDKMKIFLFKKKVCGFTKIYEKIMKCTWRYVNSVEVWTKGTLGTWVVYEWNKLEAAKCTKV